MKRNILYILSIFLLSFCLTFCTKEDNNDPAPEESEETIPEDNKEKLSLDKYISLTGETLDLKQISSKPYKLTVVYFVPNDIRLNPFWRERLTKILYEYEIMFAEAMDRNGYGKNRYFGLELTDNGLINIIKVPGKLSISEYPYNGGASGARKEIEEFFERKGIIQSNRHVLVISARNNREDVPFYGLGTWCYACDDPMMSLEKLFNGNDQSNYIGGLLHELGHGLNLPHVGPTKSQKANLSFGIPMMGSGNISYGRNPTFIHETSCAILNNCQVFANEERSFYTENKAEVSITDVHIEGDNILVEGDFINAPQNETATDVNIRFYKAGEKFLGGGHGYTSIAFRGKIDGNKYTGSMPYSELLDNFPGTDTIQQYYVGASVVFSDGNIKSKNREDILVYKKKGDSKTAVHQTVFADRSAWNVTASHALPTDINIKNSVNSLIDGNFSTCLSLVKPGRSYEDITVAADEEVSFTIDFGKEEEFSNIVLHNRANFEFLSPREIALLKSDDGVNFTPIKETIKLNPKANKNIISVANTKTKCIKIVYTDWNKDKGNTIQLSELFISD